MATKAQKILDILMGETVRITLQTSVAKSAWITYTEFKGLPLDENSNIVDARSVMFVDEYDNVVSRPECKLIKILKIEVFNHGWAVVFEESKKKYEEKRDTKKISFNKKTEVELLKFANSIDFSKWVKAKIKAELNQE